MQFGPDLSSDEDEEGFSDDPEYEEFMERIQAKRRIEHNSSNNNHKAKLQAISMAISLGRNDTVMDELNKGFEVEIDLGDGWTPLQLASSVANDFVVREVIQRGANVNSTRDTCTPLLLACNIKIDESNKTAVYNVVKTLLDNGADINVVDKRRRNALMLAAFNNNLDVVQLLLPMIDKNIEDNQKWTVLYWAVNGKAIDCVKFLLNENFDLKKTDFRGRTAIDIANERGFEEIIDLLTTQQPIKYSPFVVDPNENFNSLIQTIDKHGRQTFTSDTLKILYATRCENLIPNFIEKHLSLFDLLSCNDADLVDYGVEFPYERKRILSGLYKFHKKAFHPKTIPRVKKNDIYSNIDTAAVILNCTKQSLVMEASLQFLMKNYNDKLPVVDRDIIVIIRRIKRTSAKLEILTKQLAAITRIWDQHVEIPDLIGRKRRNIPWGNVFATTGLLLGATTLIVLYRAF